MMPENKCAEKTNGVAGPGRNAYDVLNERGFLKQCSHPEELRELLGKEKLTILYKLSFRWIWWFLNRILFLFFRHFLKKVAQPLYALANALLGLCGEVQAEGVLTFARGCEERRTGNERNFTLDRTLEARPAPRRSFANFSAKKS